jgi:hypothetical protein
VFAIWIGIRANQARNQKLAVEAILKLGGAVVYDFEPSNEESQRRWEERQSAIAAGQEPRVYEDGPFAPAWLVELFGPDLFSRVVEVQISRSMASAEDLAVICRLPFLRRLALQALPNLTDDGLKHVGQLSQLEALYISDNNLVDHGYTDRGIGHLNRLRSLVELRMDNSHIGDDALQHLRQLTRLEHLSVEGTNVTVAGLKHLSDHVNLR